MVKMMKMGKMGECACDWGGSILAVIMVALGIWFLVGGFVTQLSVTGRSFDWMVAVWYVIGVALVMWGKIWGYKSCGCCPVHGWGG